MASTASSTEPPSRSWREAAYLFLSSHVTRNSSDNSVTQQRFGDLITYFYMTERYCYHSLAFFHALIFELDEFVEYLHVMTELAKEVRVKVVKSNIDGQLTPTAGAFLPLPNSHFQQLHTQNKANTANVDLKVTTEPGLQSQLSVDLKTAIRFQYKQILEHLASASSTRSPPELAVALVDSQYSLQCTIQSQIASDMSVYFRLKYMDDDISKLWSDSRVSLGEKHGSQSDRPVRQRQLRYDQARENY